MPHSSYETLRGAIEAGIGFDAPPVDPPDPLQAEEIGRLTQANLALRETVRALQAELTECRRREAFLWDALVSLQYVMSDSREAGTRPQAIAGSVEIARERRG